MTDQPVDPPSDLTLETSFTTDPAFVAGMKAFGVDVQQPGAPAEPEPCD